MSRGAEALIDLLRLVHDLTDTDPDLLPSDALKLPRKGCCKRVRVLLDILPGLPEDKKSRPDTARRGQNDPVAVVRKIRCRCQPLSDRIGRSVDHGIERLGHGASHRCQLLKDILRVLLGRLIGK